MGIIIKNIPVESHHFIGMVEYYHRLFRQIYSIITTTISGIEPNLALQISFKIINDLRSFNWLIPTLLVFGIYLKMIELNVLSQSIIQCVMAIQKAVDEVQKCTAL